MPSLSSSLLRLVKTTSSLNGDAGVSAQWPFVFRESKTPPSEHAHTAILWTCLPLRSTWHPCACTKPQLPHLFLISNWLPPVTRCLTGPCQPVNTSSPLSLRWQTRDLFSPLSVWLPCQCNFSLLRTSGSQCLTCCALGQMKLIW